MKWEEREVVVDIELVSLDPLTFERTREPRIVPAERCLYTCECGVTVGPKLVVPHLESHGEEAPPERLAGMVQSASEARGRSEESEGFVHESHANASVGSSLPESPIPEHHSESAEYEPVRDSDGEPIDGPGYVP